MSDLAPTRTPAFEARLRKRYAAERRFRLAGLAAILFSIVVLVFLLITMTVNGIGGFQRATFKVPVDFSAVGLTMPPGSLDRAAGVRALEGQGLPDVVRFSAEQALGEEAAEHLSADAWRVVAEEAVADPTILLGKPEFSLPARENLASALDGEDRPTYSPSPAGSPPRASWRRNSTRASSPARTPQIRSKSGSGVRSRARS